MLHTGESEGFFFLSSCSQSHNIQTMHSKVCRWLQIMWTLRKETQTHVHVKSITTAFFSFSSTWCDYADTRELVTYNGVVSSHVTVQISFLCFYTRACTDSRSILPNQQHVMSPCSHKVTQPWITEWSSTQLTNNTQTCALQSLMPWSSELQDSRRLIRAISWLHLCAIWGVKQYKVLRNTREAHSKTV